MTAEPLLLLDGVRCEIPTPNGVARILEDVSLRLEQGETLGIVGESGSGKSMLARVVMGVQTPSARVSGSILVTGEQVVGAGVDRLRALWARRIAMVFQDSATTFNPVVRIGRQLTEVMRARLGLNRADAEAKALRLLQQMQISEPARRLRQYPHELSGGMRQRVAIAMAVACDPEILIADEATTALDVTVQQQILDLLQQVQAERRMGMILISHDLALISGRSDRIAVMYGGRIAETGRSRQLFADPRHRYTRALLDSIPTHDQPRHTRLVTIPGTPPKLDALPDGCRFAPRCAFATDECRIGDPPLVAVSSEHTHRCVHPVTTQEAS